MYKHILVGFDDSEDSMNALRRAAQMYSMHRGLEPKITVVHVQRESVSESAINHYPVVPGIDGGIYPTQIPLHEDELSQDSQQTIDDISSQVIGHAKAFLNQQNIPAEFESLDGSPSSDLCDFALEHYVDLIIVGNSGKGALKKLLVGSVSESIMKKAEMDVLVVK